MARDAQLREHTSRGRHCLTRLTGSVSVEVATAALRDPARLNDAFHDAWTATWAPAIELLHAAVRDQHDDDAAPGTAGRRAPRVILLNRFQQHTLDVPWGPPLREVITHLPHATHQTTGSLAVAAGPRLVEWLRTYYVPSLEPAPATLPAVPGDTTTTYTLALGIWQNDRSGPLSRLAEALETARNMTTPLA